MSPDDELMISNARNMQKYTRSSKRKQKRHQEIQPRYHTRNDHGIIESEESQQTAETRPRQTDHTPRQTG